MSLPRKQFRERLGYYIMGVAIGCMALGFARLGAQMYKRGAPPAPAAVEQPAP